MQMTIGELARLAGVHVETVRYYQRRGLLATPPRPSGGVRRYGGDAAARLRFIKRAARLSEVEARITHLHRMRKTLRTLISQCDAGGARSCPIIDSLSA